MSADFPSSNPFRRKASATATPTPQSNPSTTQHAAYQAADPQPGSLSLESIDVPKKITKKVRVQSPPPLSPSTPSLPDSNSTIGEENYSFSARPPTPPIPQDDDPFDTTTSDISEDEELSKPNKAPANPFSRTLETMEHPQRDIPTIPPTGVSSPGRASMDVEAFKRLLMTGSAEVGTSTPPTASQVHVVHALGDGGSSTDASSVSRQSIFEAIQEPHPESPRTSHEISEPEDDRRQLRGEISYSSGRKKPPPPNSRHGKLIRVELRDDTTLSALQSPPTPGSITSQHYFSSSPRSQTDLNKPLPPAPNRASHDSDRESIFDKEAAGKTPESPSPESLQQKKTAPAPPLSRRHSQKVPESKLNRPATARLSPKPEEELSSASLTPPPNENTRPRSNSGRAPPPPAPPSRRIGSVRMNSSSQNLPLSSPSSVSLPSPPPARGTARSISGGKPPSVHSMDLSTPSNKRASVMPPPPPPPRHGRTSFDGQSPGTSRRTSSDYPRRSMDSARRGSAASSVLQMPEEVQGPAGHDILADLSKLQAEIDALRNQAEKERVL
ncbi:uncharacterized protein LY89DRAFT_126828 [Mollisia scopiformis]|uniref:Uncharacterized protein n=1 Tax=Mollisia scopiformis TaxID=149040 RepID=A0A194X4I7_MOLSC|nr:uncharacterized protein LY89DRAFT_126828 [Mollisia scopiformis]KUJ14974.1 hypothetical protein LY89DRAFT_126828 [Mollisia scopiformis]